MVLSDKISFTYPIMIAIIGGPIFYILYGVTNGLIFNTSLTRLDVFSTMSDNGVKSLSVLMVLPVMPFAYFLLVRFVEKRKVIEFSKEHMVSGILFGAFLGSALLALTVFIILLFGDYKIITLNPVSTLVYPFLLGVYAGIFEEIIFRGIIFRNLEKVLGTYIALLLSASLFGFFHLSNPNATVFSSLAIAVEAGLLLGICYVLTRKLWLPIGLHFGWNFTEGGIFGANISGIEGLGSLVNSTFSGSDWITGGVFGPEASVPALVICTSAFMVLLYFSHRKGRIIVPNFSRVR